MLYKSRISSLITDSLGSSRLQELGMLLPGALAKSPHGFQCWRIEGESRRHLKSWYSEEMRLSHGRAKSNTLQSSAALAVHGRTPSPWHKEDSKEPVTLMGRHTPSPWAPSKEAWPSWAAQRAATSVQQLRESLFSYG